MLSPVSFADAPARIDPEDPLGVPAAPIIEWFRIDETRRIGRYLAVGAAGMATASLALARLVLTAPLMAHVGSRSPTRYPIMAGDGLLPAAAVPISTVALALLGFGALVGCGLFAILGLKKVLSEESYLALRVDGVLFVRADGTRRFARWEEIEDVRHEAAGDAVVLAMHEGEPWALAWRFAGAGNAEIARKAAAVRRRALFGMYKR
jgi:hypothetical protein